MDSSPHSGALTGAALESVAPGLSPTPVSAASADADASLMLRYRDGDVRAFEVLYSRHKGPLYRYLQRLCRNQEIANDLFQEVWSKVIASRERYEARAQFNTFLFRIAHNSAVDYFRRAPHQQASRTDDVAEMADELAGPATERPDARLSEAQLRTAFKRALQELPPEQRDVFLLYEETGLSLDEISKMTGVAMETAKSRLRYALKKLRAGLQQYAPGNPAVSTQP